MLNVEEEKKNHLNGKHRWNGKQHCHPSQNKDALIEVWRRTLTKWNPFDDKVVKPGKQYCILLNYLYTVSFIFQYQLIL